LYENVINILPEVESSHDDDDQQMVNDNNFNDNESYHSVMSVHSNDDTSDS